MWDPFPVRVYFYIQAELCQEWTPGVVSENSPSHFLILIPKFDFSDLNCLILIFNSN